MFAVHNSSVVLNRLQNRHLKGVLNMQCLLRCCDEIFAANAINIDVATILLYGYNFVVVVVLCCPLAVRWMKSCYFVTLLVWSVF